jgi:hypothetical protein
VETYTYQWQSDSVDISGATSKTYTLVTGDEGAVITCIVTGTNNYGTDVATSVATDAVTST